MGAVERPAALLNAVVRSRCAPCAVGSATWLVPFTVPGGKPDTELPGHSPRSPLSIVSPLLVTVEPARTLKFPALPKATGNSAAEAICWQGARAAVSKRQDAIDELNFSLKNATLVLFRCLLVIIFFCLLSCWLNEFCCRGVKLCRHRRRHRPVRDGR